MNLVSVVLVKNINIVVVVYKRNKKDTKEIQKIPAIMYNFFLSYKMEKKSFELYLVELNSSKLLINPLFLQIFKNLFFLSLKISSGDMFL